MRKIGAPCVQYGKAYRHAVFLNNIEFFIAQTGYSFERLFDVVSGPDQRGYGYNKNEWRQKIN
jgi:hypothetical protein